jgi:predicted Zn-dependent protease
MTQVQNSAPLRDGLLAAYRALAAGDLTATVVAWRNLRDALPGFAPAYVEEAALLRRLGDPDSAVALIDAALARFPGHPEVAVAHTAATEAAGDWAKAAELAADLRRRFPARPEGYVIGARALRHLWNLSEAAAVLDDASRFGRLRPLEVERARLAAARDDLAGAAAGWAEILATWPGAGERDDDLPGHDAPDPADIRATTEHGLGLLQEGRIAEAEQLFEQMRGRFPDVDEGYVGGIAVLRRAKRFNEAEAFLARALNRFPDSAWLAGQAGWCATERNDFTTADTRWAVSRARFPDNPEAFSIGGLALLRLGRLDEAEAVLAEGIQRHPRDPFTLWQYAESATMRRDFAEAHRRYAHAAAIHPDMREIVEGRGQLLLLEQMAAIDDPSVSPAAPSSGGGAEPDEASLFLAFESIGCNCEFGIAQRAAGVEPLGLLRWGATDVNRLIAMLDAKLADIGEDRFTRLEYANGEYSVADPRFFDMHTFIQRTDADPEVLRRQMARRLRFLADKLREDLADAEKIFVYQQADARLDDADILAMHAALRRHGPARLLAVRHPRGDEQDGSVTWLAEGVMLGFIAALDHTPMAARQRYDDWLNVCRQAYRMAGGMPR